MGVIGGIIGTAAAGVFLTKYQEKRDTRAAEEAARKARKAEQMKAKYEARKVADEETLESDTHEDDEGDTSPTQSS